MESSLGQTKQSPLKKFTLGPTLTGYVSGGKLDLAAFLMDGLNFQVQSGEISLSSSILVPEAFEYAVERTAATLTALELALKASDNQSGERENDVTAVPQWCVPSNVTAHCEERANRNPLERKPKTKMDYISFWCVSLLLSVLCDDVLVGWPSLGAFFRVCHHIFPHIVQFFLSFSNKNFACLQALFFGRFAVYVGCGTNIAPPLRCFQVEIPRKTADFIWHGIQILFL